MSAAAAEMAPVRRVAVLKGGWSPEREVSLVTGAACAEGLREAGFEVAEIDVRRDLPALVAALTPPPDAVFNALHGKFGEDGCVQGVLEFLGIPYTHSGVLASAVAMDKAMAKTVFAAAGLRCPEGVVMRRTALAQGDPMPRPFVVKPVDQGSSVGVHIVHEGDNAMPTDEDWPYGDTVLVERFVPGRELTVAVLGDRAIAVTELRPSAGFYDYRAKYTEGVTEHVLPAEIPPAVYQEALRAALEAHRALGCSGLSRCDFRYDDRAGDPSGLYLLELNTQPGMTPLSLAPEQAKWAGIPFPRLMAWMVEHARWPS